MSKVLRHLGKLLSKRLHPSYHFYAGVWGIIIGISYGNFAHRFFNLSWLWLVVAGLFFLIALRFSRIISLPLAIFAGILLATYRISFELRGQAQFANLVGQTIAVQGTIAEDPDSDNNMLKLRLNNLKLFQTDAVENLWKSGGKVDENCGKTVEKPDSTCGEYLSLPGTLYVSLSTTAQLERSDIIVLKGKIGAGFGIFVGSLYRPSLLQIQKPDPPNFFVQTKNWFSETVRRFIPSPAAELGLGYLMGMKTGLPENLLTALQLVGMTHVVVASGAHLGILTNLARKVFGKFSKFAGTLAAFLMICAFVGLVGFTPSMTRAGLVTALSLIVGYFGRKFAPFRLISLVAALTLMLAPTNLFHLGWQLSFASFFGIMLISPRLQKLLYGGKKVPWLAGMLITSISTSFTCAPILIYNFGSISLLSLVANLFILPTLPYAMLSVFLTAVASPFATIASFCGQIGNYLLNFHIGLVDFLSEKTMFIFEFGGQDWRIFLLYLPIIIFLLAINLYKFFSLHKTNLAYRSYCSKNEAKF